MKCINFLEAGFIIPHQVITDNQKVIIITLSLIAVFAVIYVNNIQKHNYSYVKYSRSIYLSPQAQVIPYLKTNVKYCDMPGKWGLHFFLGGELLWLEVLTFYQTCRQADQHRNYMDIWSNYEKYRTLIIRKWDSYVYWPERLYVTHLLCKVGQCGRPGQDMAYIQVLTGDPGSRQYPISQ